MAKPILLLTAVLLVGCTYAVWPLVAAFQIKQAIHAGDVATLERMVQWAPVRASLKASIAALPPEALMSDQPPRTGTPTRRLHGQSLWTRIKAAAEPFVVDRMIDTYVSATGIAKLQRARQNGRSAGLFTLPGLRASPGRLPQQAPTDPGPWGRFFDFYARIRDARFLSLTLVDIDVSDPRDSRRHWISRFTLNSLQWQLASLRVVQAVQ